MQAATYAIWTIGCQMNEADSRHLAARLEDIGYRPAPSPDDADLVVLNTCVVRQHAEDKIYGRLGALRKRKQDRPRLRIVLMGCLVGVNKNNALKHRFPFVDFFAAPSEIEPLIAFLADGADTARETSVYHLPQMESNAVTAFIPAVLGCSHGCAYCVIPGKRGREYSRPAADILEEISLLVNEGVREVMLLGQIVDRYGLDIPDGPDLADLLREVASIDNLARVRFLTSHPKWITDKLLHTVAEVDKICPQMEIAVQAGNNEVLRRMRRGYTVEQFRELIARVRATIPDAAIHTDIIVGFPGETNEQFNDTVRLLEDIRFDKVHIAKYSERPGTPAAELYEDDVTPHEKERRRKRLDDLQKDIQTEQCAALNNSIVEVLVETRDKNRWRGRSPQNKIVFFEDDRELAGHLVPVRIDWAGPFSLIGHAVEVTV
ncbi:MAG: tRNA (N6-isopentenyl adenosine(37)-C2)-methylthiotransferase MiaB [Spartobacteria bacterium]|nr:tRNA (N6-isopentenyl adenosine(37)-C2)-methylthiotransferase MiaB [Spartobacteria bacterium]